MGILEDEQRWAAQRAAFATFLAELPPSQREAFLAHRERRNERESALYQRAYERGVDLSPPTAEESERDAAKHREFLNGLTAEQRVVHDHLTAEWLEQRRLEGERILRDLAELAQAERVFVGRLGPVAVDSYERLEGRLRLLDSDQANNNNKTRSIGAVRVVARAMNCWSRFWSR